MSDFTPGEWKWWTSNSYKRLVATDGPSTTIVLAPYIAADGHPDLDIDADDMALIEQARLLFVVLKQIIDELPTSRDWLDPNLERAAIEVLNAATGKEK